MSSPSSSNVFTSSGSLTSIAGLTSEPSTTPSRFSFTPAPSYTGITTPIPTQNPGSFLSSGTNYFFGFLVAVIVVGVALLGLRLYSRRRRVLRMRRDILLGLLPGAGGDGDDDGDDDDEGTFLGRGKDKRLNLKAEPLLWEPVFGGMKKEGRAEWKDLIPLSATLVRRPIFVTDEPSDVLLPQTTLPPPEISPSPASELASENSTPLPLPATSPSPNSASSPSTNSNTNTSRSRARLHLPRISNPFALPTIPVYPKRTKVCVTEAVNVAVVIRMPFSGLSLSTGMPPSIAELESESDAVMSHSDLKPSAARERIDGQDDDGWEAEAEAQAELQLGVFRMPWTDEDVAQVLSFDGHGEWVESSNNIISPSRRPSFRPPWSLSRRGTAASASASGASANANHPPVPPVLPTPTLANQALTPTLANATWNNTSISIPVAVNDPGSPLSTNHLPNALVPESATNHGGS